MKRPARKDIAIVFLVILICASWVAFFYITDYCTFIPLKKPNNSTLTIGYNVYAEVQFFQYGKLKYYFSGLDPVTKLGLNLTFAKLTGYFTSAYNESTYPQNCTYVSIGDGSPDEDSTYLPWEWAKVSGTFHAVVYNGFNITGTINPSASGYSANCMGINYEGTANSTSLYAYTTFAEVTGIDSSFTIVCEIQVQGTTT